MFKIMSSFLNTFSGFIMKGFNEIEQEQLKEIFFQILSTINLHKNFIEILVSVNKYFAYQSFCLQQAWFIDAHFFLSTLFFLYIRHGEELESYRTFINLSYVKINFIVEIVWKQKTTKFLNSKQITSSQLVYSIDIKTLGPACKVQTFQHGLSISWSSYSNFFFKLSYVRIVIF